MTEGAQDYLWLKYFIDQLANSGVTAKSMDALKAKI